MADQIRATPQNPTLGAIAAALRKAQQFTGQYQVDPRVPLLGGTGVDELLSLPGAASLVEDVSYNGPRALIRGGNAATGGIGTFRPDPRVADLADVATMIPATSLANKGAMALGRAGERAAERIVPRVMERGGKGAELLAALAQGTTSNVVKPKGGNWLAGSVENAVQPLRSKPEWLSGEMINEAAGDNLWAKMVEEGGHHDPHAWLQKNRPDIYNQFIGPEGAAVNRWLDTKLTKYIRNEMGTPEDPVRALAERGIVHQEQNPLNTYNVELLEDARARAGFPSEGMANTRAGREWEAAADNAITQRSAEDIVRQAETGRFGGERERAQMFLEKDPWITNLPPDTQLHAVDSFGPTNMFGHLVDELKFSMDPNSNLPQHLRFDAKDIDKITVPQAVERVSQINAWRAQEAAKAEKAGMLENLQATPRMPDEGLQLSFVDKPGGAWVDIPETTDAKGMQVCNSIGKAGGWCTQHEWAGRSYGSGENRLTALVDAEGRPHAQAKITQDVDQMAAIDDATMYMTPEQELAYDRHFQKLDRPPELEESLEWLQENAPDAYAVYHEVLTSQPKSPPSITELKPVGNSFKSERAQEYMKRDPQYKQKVTESVLKFLNSGEWGKVNDLDHYDIVDLQRDPTMLLAYLRDMVGGDSRTAQAVFNAAVDANPEAPRFMTPRQLRAFVEPFKPVDDMKPGYAGGGLVKGAVKGIGEMVEKYLAKEAPEDVGTTFYRGIPRLKGDVEEISGLHAKERGKPVAASPHLKANTRGYAWASDNPMVASSYTHFGGAVVPLELTEKPGAVLDARGLPWNSFFFQKVPQWVDPKQKMLLLQPEFREALDDPNVRSVLVKNIKDYGMESEKPAFREMLSQRLFQKPFNELNRDQQYELFNGAGLTGNNLLIKDPSIMRYKFTGEAPGFAGGGLVSLHAKYAQGGFVDGGLTDQDGVDRMVDAQNAAEGGRIGYAAGGLVNYDPNEIDTIVSRLKEEIYA